MAAVPAAQNLAAMVNLGADTLTWAHALTCGLVMADFLESPAIAWGDLTNATFTGSAAKTISAGVRVTGIDPATGDVLMNIDPPTGGFYWETTATTSLPQTIFGMWLGNDTLGFGNGTLLAAVHLNEPVILAQVNQAVIIPQVTIRLPFGSLV